MNFFCTVLPRILNILIFSNRVISVICICQSLWSFIKRQTSGTSSDNKWQRMTTNDTMSDSEWQRVITIDKEWQRVAKSSITSDNEWQRLTTSGTTSDREWYNEWQRVAINGNEWERVTTLVQRVKTAQYTSKNEWLPSSQWQKQAKTISRHGWLQLEELNK